MPRREIKIAIPADLRFADLQLQRNRESGAVSFSWAAIDAVCRNSGVDIDLFIKSSEANIAGLIVQWYEFAIAAGEPKDPVAERLMAETADEMEAGIEPTRLQ